MNVMEYSGEWLTGLDLNGKVVTVVITEVAVVEVKNQRGEKRQAPAVRFRSVAGIPLRKRLLLTAKCNIVSLAKLFGTETDGWTGQAVMLKPEDITAFGETFCVVRIAGRGKLPTAASTNGHAPALAEPLAEATELA